MALEKIWLSGNRSSFIPPASQASLAILKQIPLTAANTAQFDQAHPVLRQLLTKKIRYMLKTNNMIRYESDKQRLYDTVNIVSADIRTVFF